MAEASLRAGAIGLRLDGPEHIGAVRRRCPEALIVGLWKRRRAGSPVTITPDWQDIQAVWAAGADIVAIDATERARPGGESLASLVERSRGDLGAPLMADVDSVASGLRASELGFQWIATTLYGYTETTAEAVPPAWNLLGPMRRQLPADVGLICEGGLSCAEDALRALEFGADAVVVGAAITGVDLAVGSFVKLISNHRDD